MTWNNIRGVVRGLERGGGARTPYASILERAGLAVLTMTPGHETVWAQKPRLEFSDPDGRPRSYRPDLSATWNCRAPRLVQELKYQSELERDRSLTPHFERLAEMFAANGDRFTVVTDEQLFNDRFESLQHIEGYRNFAFCEIEEQVVEFVRARGDCLVGDALTAVATSGTLRVMVLPSVWRAVARLRIFADFREAANERMSLFARPLATRIVNPTIPEPIADAIDAHNRRQDWRAAP